MKYQYVIGKDGDILHCYKGDPIVFGGPWQYAQQVESTIKDGKAIVKNGKVTIVKGD